MLSSTSGTSFSTSTDRPIDGLDTAGPASRVAISRFGRWVLFDSGDGKSLTDSVEFQEGVMVWAADLRVAADGSIADTTTTTTTTTHHHDPTTTPTPTATTTTTTVPGTAGRATPVVIALTPTPPVVRVPTFSGSSTTSRRFTTGDVGGDSAAGLLVVQPQSVTFQPMIVDAGRSTSVVSLTNAGGSTVTVRSVRLEPTTRCLLHRR